MDMIQAVKSKVTERLEAGSREHVVTIIIYNLSELVQTLTIDMQEQLEFILEKGLKAGYASIIMSPASLSRNIDPISKIAKNYKQALLAMRVSDQSILTVTNRIVREPQLEEQEHYYIVDNQANKVKVIMQ